MDAVSFAVGLQSKDLRGRQLKDLIYRGRRQRCGYAAAKRTTREAPLFESSPPALRLLAQRSAGPR